MKYNLRIGMGYDIHRTSGKSPLFIGGVKIECNFGLEGHSDADVLLHSICDSLLGSISEGDIGIHFPNTDKRYKNISSILLLSKVNGIVRKKGYRINNIDTMIIAQKPKLSPYFLDMKKAIASVLKLERDRINIKATTPEKLDSIGRGKAIAAYSVVLVCKK